jgi:hypothetical protein
LKKLAWLYIALREQEYEKVSKLFEDVEWVKTEIFDLTPDSDKVFYVPENTSCHAVSPSGNRSANRDLVRYADEYVIVQLMKGVRFNDLSDTNWSFWGISVSPHPGGTECTKIAKKLTEILQGLDIPTAQFQTAYFANDAKDAYTDLERGSN